MRNEQTSIANRYDASAKERALESSAPDDDFEDFDLRKTLDDIVVRSTTFGAFREALVRFRGPLH